ncbi:hypothetical protein ACER0C_003284 [Sarotherodon galilaeus]
MSGGRRAAGEQLSLGPESSPSQLNTAISAHLHRPLSVFIARWPQRERQNGHQQGSSYPHAPVGHVALPRQGPKGHPEGPEAGLSGEGPKATTTMHGSNPLRAGDHKWWGAGHSTACNQTNQTAVAPEIGGAMAA